MIDKIKLIEGWGEKSFKNQKGQLWFLISYKPDMTNAENKVIIIDPSTATLKQVNVGFNPIDIFFMNDNTYVVCVEDGENPSIYRIDTNFNVSKWKTIEHGGLISGAQSDGKNIYWSSLKCHDNPDLDYPMLVKVSLDGSIEIKKLADKRIGFNNLLYLNNKLYLGLEEEKGNFVEFDAKTLEPLRYFPYNDMVGDIIPVGKQKLAISNYSKRMGSGSTITIFDLKDGNFIINKGFCLRFFFYRDLSYKKGKLRSHPYLFRYFI